MDFLNEHPHSEKLVARGRSPWNAEPDVRELLKYNYTPEELVYCRNHSPVHALHECNFGITVEGLVKVPRRYTAHELRETFPKKEVVAALQCAGNRRRKMVEKYHKHVEGLLWDEGTICNCKWAGVSMRDLLRSANVLENENTTDGTEGLHLCFASHISACQDDDWFGASIPLDKAMDEDGDVILAYEMNGQPLSPDHGYPLRIVVPGFSGVRWVKWVDRIAVSRSESENFYQQRDYKVLPPQIETHEMADQGSWWTKLPAIQANSLNSVVGIAEIVSPATLHVEGYAVPGTSGQVCQVEISIDEGMTWRPTMITYQEGRWSWTLWDAQVALPTSSRRKGKVWSRAISSGGETQQLDSAWNLRGVSFSAVGEKLFYEAVCS